MGESKVVRAGDGTEIFLTEANGPVTRDGQHADYTPEADPAPEVKPAKAAPKRDPRTPGK